MHALPRTIILELVKNKLFCIRYVSELNKVLDYHTREQVNNKVSLLKFTKIDR